MNSFIFFGGKTIGNFILNGLIEQKLVPTGVVCYRNILEDTLLEKCEQLGVKILRLHNFKNNQDQLVEFIKELSPKFYISVAFPFVLSKEILEMVELPINIHTGALPRYRGHHPLSAALLNNEPVQATTVHFMVEEVDAGKVLLQDFISVSNEDDIVTIRKRLIDLSLKLVLIVINQVNNGTHYAKDQVGEIIWAPKRLPEDSKINFDNNSRYLHNFIRSVVHPYPNAFAFTSEGKKVNFKKSIAKNVFGMVLEKISAYKYVVSSNDGVILVETDTELNIGDILS
jgi:methionyl-tRNA formyltransferase